ncbi:MAG: hypothetical protein RLZZ387_3497 [Chloroflexota bacterium]
MDAGAEKVLALCPCCEFQLRVSAEKKRVPVEVVDLAHFVAEALRYELPDPHPEVKAHSSLAFPSIAAPEVEACAYRTRVLQSCRTFVSSHLRSTWASHRPLP